MKGKLALVLFLTAIVLIDHSIATDAAKSREKRSPKPNLFGFLAKLIGQAAKQAPKLAQKAITAAGKFARKNPGKAAGAAAAAAGAGIIGVGAIAGSGGQPGNKQCALHIRRDLPDLQPVFIKDGPPRELMVPTHGYLTWAHGETSSIACPSSSSAGNHIVATNNIVDTITCDNGLMFKLNGVLVNIRTITCSHKVTGNYEPRQDAECAGNSTAIGFNVPFPSGNEFLDLYYSCFDETTASILYTSHIIFGTELGHKYIYGGDRPDFKAAGFPNGVAVRSAYTQSNQSARLANIFSAILGNSVAQTEAQSYYSRSYLQKGHLTPDGDELFSTWQWATYFFINVAGMWEKINIGNWKTLEGNVRTLAMRRSEDLHIYTGTYGILEVCSISIPIYCPEFTLVNGGIPVPKWLWKIVKDPTSDEAIALVVSNNPFKSETPICGSRQTDYGWRQNGFDDIWYGDVSYCTVQELQRVVGYIPRSAEATNVLHF